MSKPRTRTLTALVAILILAGLALPPVGAQEEGGFPYFYVVTANVAPGMQAAYAEAVAAIAEASRKHENGRTFATYSNFTGEGTLYVHFLPLATIGDMDGWGDLGQILAESLGAERATKVLGTLGQAAETRNRLIDYQPGMSNPPTGADAAPPAVLYYVGYRPQADQIAGFNEVASKFFAAARKNEKALHFTCYTTMIGGEGNEYAFFAGLDGFAELDGAPQPQEVLAAEYGQAEAQRMLGIVGAVESERGLFTYVPALSNVPGQ